jgi:hypothetical protein
LELQVAHQAVSLLLHMAETLSLQQMVEALGRLAHLEVQVVLEETEQVIYLQVNSQHMLAVLAEQVVLVFLRTFQAK